MPYIKPDRRPFYDELASSFALQLQDPLEENYSLVEKIFVYHMTHIATEFQDGDLNYFFTKLLKVLNIDTMYLFESKKIRKDLVEFMVKTLLKIYTYPKEQYFNYNRMLGMVLACELEFRRRFKQEGINVILTWSIFIEVIERLYETVSEYEDKKILENGDV